MKYLNIAIRNLSRQKKRSLLLGGAIAFGILMITLVNAFTAGATQNVKENFSYLLAGHIYISEETKRDDGEVLDEFLDDSIVLQELEKLGVEDSDMVKRSSMFATMLFNGRQTSQSVQGIRWDQEPQLVERMKLVEGSVDEAREDPRGLIISEQAAESLKVQLGEEITIRTNTITGQQNVGSFVVRAIMTDPGILGSLSSYANLDRVNEMINLSPGSYQTLNITLDSLEQVDPVTNRLYAALEQRAQVAPRDERQGLNLGDLSFTFQEEEEEPWDGSRFVVQNINDFTSQIDQLSQTLNLVGLWILVLLIIITMVGVTNTFRMIMYERVKEIGTMRAVGMQRKGVRRIFLWEAASLGTLGYVIGLILAVIAGFFIGFIQIPQDSPFSLFTLSGSITFPFTLGALIFNYIFVTGMTVIAASFPANKAAKAQPADALRS